MNGIKFIQTLGICVTFMLLSALSQATIYYVAPNGNDSQSGLTWPSAFATISNAVAKADADLVILSNGTYTLSTQVIVDKAITVTGFYGAAQTVVNGAGVTRCFFLSHSNAVLSDLTISNGCVTNYTLSNGGGVYIATNASMRNCLVGWCSATNGGGIFAVTNATISGCTVMRNIATNSTAGVYAGGYSRVLDCLIMSNTAGYTCGGLYLDNSMASNCTVLGNRKITSAAVTAAGVYMTGSGSMLYNSTITANVQDPGGAMNRGVGGVLVEGGTIQNCVISYNWNNDDFMDASGLYLYGASTGINCTVVGNYGWAAGGVQLANDKALLRDSVISNNIASGYVAGVYFWKGTMLNCIIANNSGLGTAAGGVSMYALLGDGPHYLSNCVIRANSSAVAGAGLGFYCNSGKSYVRNCLITENVSNTNGGGIHITAAGSMVNCTIVSNYAWRGGGVTWNSTNAMGITNCIIYGNVISDVGNVTNIDLYDAGAPTNMNSLAYSCSPYTNYFRGPGNKTNNPLFLYAAGKDFRLANGSPCIDSGVSQAWMNAGATDLGGHRRILGATVDIGAYEYGDLICNFSGTPRRSSVPSTNTFTSYVSGTNMNGLYYKWDFTNVGTVYQEGFTLASATNIYNQSGYYSVALQVFNNLGETGSWTNINYIKVSPITYYVVPGGQPAWPYTNWPNGANNIQHAVNDSSDGDLILVSNGTYQLSGQLSITNGITVKSPYGNAIMSGSRSPTTNRCVYMSHTNAILEGFIITNGWARGGQGWTNNGGGVYINQGGTLRSCLIFGNMATNNGGGVYIFTNGVLKNCTLADNLATNNGGGVYIDQGGQLENTIVYHNFTKTTVGTNWFTNSAGAVFINSCLAPANVNGPGNISGDPQFVNTNARNYRLLRSSPCINRGMNAVWMYDAVDLAGHKRINDCMVDMGAYELGFAGTVFRAK